jgi:hypothetical protein
VLYAFLPSRLIRQSVWKVLLQQCANGGTCGDYGVALASFGPMLNTLASDGYERVRSPGTHLQHVTRYVSGYDPRELAVSVCDFAALGRRADGGVRLALPCACAYAPRRRPLCESVEDAADRGC